MKHIFSLAFFSLLVVFAAAQKPINDPNVQLRTLNGSFHSIVVSGGIDLYISPGSETVAVSASHPEDRELIKTEVQNGVLKIWQDNTGGLRSFFKGGSNYRVYVSYKTLQSLKASGGCDVFSDDVIRSSSLNLSLSGGCDFTGKVDVNDLKVDQSGGTDIRISGRAAKADISASGGSDFKGAELVTDVANVDASGASDIDITANKEISASASGASDVTYRGTPQVKASHASGAGSVRKKS